MRIIDTIFEAIGKRAVMHTMLLSLMITMGQAHGQTAPQYFNASLASLASSNPLNSPVDNRVQWLYSPGAFNLGGMSGNPAPMGVIDAIAFRLGPNPSGSAVYQDFTIKLAQNVGTISSWSDPLFVTGMDTVFYEETYSLVNPVGGQWHKITLQNGFFYDPSLSLVVEICVSSGTGNTVLVPMISLGTHVHRYGNHSSQTGTTAAAVIDFGFDMSPGITDAGVSGFVGLDDTLCDGLMPVDVVLKNHGQSVINTVQLDWEVNQVAQAPLSWSGSLSPGDTTVVSLGSYLFHHANTYQLKAWTSNPNQQTDTINHNDTAFKAEVFFKQSPSYQLYDTLIVMCQGDTALMQLALQGSPPWDLVITDGATPLSMTQITNSSLTIPLAPTTGKTYSLVSLSDASGCITTSGPSLSVSVQQSPNVTLQAVGATSVCDGDSVILMASVGLNFNYQWYLDGQNLSGVTGHTMAAKSGGVYTVEVITPAGCTGMSDPLPITIHPLPQVDLGGDTLLYANQHITLNAGAGFNSYLWSTGETSQTINVDSTGTGIGVKTVWVQVTDNNSCKGSDTVTIEFTPHPAVESYTTDASMQLFPNPTTGKVTLQLDRFTAGQINITLYSVDGSRVYSRQHTVTATQEQITLDLQHLPEGVYLLQSVSAKDGRKGTQSIIIQR